MTTRLWIDVEDLFDYATSNPRPSGIQRLAFEIYAALQHGHGDTGRIRFIRHDQLNHTFVDTSWTEIQRLFYTLSRPATVPPRQPGRLPWTERLRRAAKRMPLSVRNLARAHRDLLVAWSVLFRAIARRILGRLRRSYAAHASRHPPPDGFAALSTPGDVLLVLGSPWSQPGYHALVEAQRRRGLRFALLVYDLIPIVHPEWCDQTLTALFRNWFGTVLPLCDTVFAISRSTATDLAAYAARHAIPLPTPIPIPIGTGFTTMPAPSAPPAATPPGPYALVVSTIEARKNHTLLFRVWRRLLAELPEDDVPTLVFAGRIGWLVDDLLRQIANTANLGGKLLLIQDPSDADLVALYQGCRFTLFPSFYEGWGLPVTESLAFGKPCLIADRTSLPEAGAGLCRTFNPDSLDDAYAAIRDVIDHPAALAAWQADIRARFHPTPWSTTAQTLLTHLIP